MAGPAFRAAGARAQSASAATLTPGLPTVDAAHGLLIAVLQTKNNAAHATATTGWALINQTNSGAGFTASIWSAAEGSAAPVFTWTGAVACGARVFYYSAPDNTIDTTIGATSAAAGLTATHTSAAITTTRLTSLVIFADAAAAQTSLATPAGWTVDIDSGSATDAGETTVGNKPVATSGTSSGAISVTGANAAWVQWQIEIKGTAAGPLDFSKLELGPWMAPPLNQFSATKLELGPWMVPPNNDLSVSKIEAGAWLVPNDNQLRYSKMEVGIWLIRGPGGRSHLLFSSF